MPVLQLHNRYHYALFHKLRSSRTHLDNLERLLLQTPPQDIVSTSTSGDFHFNANLIIDSFFYSLGSSLDILAREVLSYYSLPMPHTVYFRTARREINIHKPGDPILPLLVDPIWKGEFSDYRNSLTHELLIVGRFSLDISIEGGIQRQKIANTN